MTDSPTYGNSTKRIVFTENDHRHAQLVLKIEIYATYTGSISFVML